MTRIRLGIGPLSDVKLTQVHDLVRGIRGEEGCFLDFAFGLKNERVIAAAERSAEAERRVAIERELHR
jgi:hypothetical protein